MFFALQFITLGKILYMDIRATRLKTTKTEGAETERTDFL